MRRWQAVLAIVTGALIIVSAGFHAFAGWPQFDPILNQASVPEGVIRGLQLGWYFGSIAMLAFGLITLLTGLNGLRSRAASRISVAVIAAAYVGFGVYAFVGTGYSPHFLLFMVLGLLAGTSAL